MEESNADGQATETFCEKLLSAVVSQDNQDNIEIIKNRFSETRVCNNNEDCIRFCKEVSREWILKTLKSHSGGGTSSGEKKRIVDLCDDCRKSDESYAQIYSYFLYFCGILFYIRREEEDRVHRVKLREFFEQKIRDTKDNNRSLLFGFLKTYIDILDLNKDTNKDPDKESIDLFEDLKSCLVNDDSNDNIIFNAIEKERDLMLEVLEKIENKGKRNDFLLDKIKAALPGKIEKAFANELKKSKYTEEKLIESIIDSRTARLYYIAGKERELDHITKLNAALKIFPRNSFALLQAAHLLLKYGKKLNQGKALGMKELPFRLSLLVDTIQNEYPRVNRKIINNDYLGSSEYLFNEVIELIGVGEQFKGFEALKYKIKFEALLGLAYVYYQKGQGQKAQDKYEEAESILREQLSTNGDYLKSILLINRGRNKFDNGPIKSNRDKSTAKQDFEKVLNFYEKAKKGPKDELVEIASLAHNNLGIYYLEEYDYETAEKQFRNAIDVDDTNVHARYNLGALYYRKGEEARAKRIFQNASNLKPDFSEAREAVERLGAMKKGGLVSEWLDWWFGHKNETKRTKKKRLPMQILAVALLVIVVTAFATLAFELYLQGVAFITHMGSGEIPELPDADEGAFIIIITISIIILMLPFISKLKISDIEIELETAGYQALGPASTGAGSNEDSQDTLRLLFFAARFWYY